MQIISQFAPLPLAQPEKGTAVAMGFFDGIHIGHRAVIESAVQWAKEHDAAPAVFTFKLPVVNKMKANEIRSMSVAELETKLVDLKKDLFMLRMQHATNHLDNPTKISAVRRDIARVKTVLREKQN